MDIRAWRARVLTWAGRLAEAEHEYDAVLKVEREDPDNWMGLATVYMQQGRMQEALKAADRAVELDPKRADLRATRAQIFGASGDISDARLEFQKSPCARSRQRGRALRSIVASKRGKAGTAFWLRRRSLFLHAREPRSVGEPGFQLDSTLDDQRRCESLPTRRHRRRKFRRQCDQEPTEMGRAHDWRSNGSRQRSDTRDGSVLRTRSRLQNQRETSPFEASNWFTASTGIGTPRQESWP